MVTDPLANVVLSKSETVMTELITVAASPSVNAKVLDTPSTGASFTETTLMKLVNTLLAVVPSVVANETERCVVAGFSLLLTYFTDRKAACHCVTVAIAPDEVRVNTPVVLLKIPPMLPNKAAFVVNTSES
jgi:hypothetical protein